MKHQMASGRIRLIIVILLMGLVGGLWGQDTRPIMDDVGYCWNPPQLERFMDYLKSTAPVQPLKNTPLPPLLAGISPHDDYLYTGRVYYQLFPHIKTPEVVIFGVTHRAPRLKMGDPQNKLVFDEYTYWKGPYGKIPVSPLREYLKKNLDAQWVTTSNEAHNMEHSIEGMLPFLQYFNRDVRITPMMVTAMPLEKMEEVSKKLATVLATYMQEKNLQPGKDIFFLISCDANHYGKDFDNMVFGEDQKAHQQGTAQDRNIADSYIAGEVSLEKIKGLTDHLWGNTFKENGNTLWCGKYSVPLGLLTVSNLMKIKTPSKKLTGKVLLYSDTYSEGVLPVKETGMGITASFSLKHWVGFFSAGFFLE